MGKPPQINLSSLVSIDRASGDTPEDTLLLKRMATDALAFMQAFSWCKEVKCILFGCGVGGVCAVFLMEIVPAMPNIDDWLWVVVGDVPPAYLVTDGAPTPSLALKVYIEEMRDWIAAVEQGRSTEDLIPVDVLPTSENAVRLGRRLSMLEGLGICQ